MQVQPLEEIIKSKTQYSNSSSKELNYSNSTVSIKTVFSNLADVIPDDDYKPFYVSRYKQLGYDRFVALANKARASGKDPARLFFWMLKNESIVR